MAGNSFGTLFKLSSFGESHGVAIGGVIDGCPAGLEIDLLFIQSELDRRKPGQSHITTQRKESDTVEFLSGIFEGKTTGAPIGFVIKNEDQKPKDYVHLKDTFRPSHADFTYEHKYGLRDYRGGGRSSARETACRIVAGAIAKLFLKKQNISVNAFVKQVGEIKLEKTFTDLDLSKIESSIVRCPDETTSSKMISYIEEIKKQGDTVGGVIQCVIQNAPIGLGEPVFDKLHAVLGHAMLNINAVKGFEIGSGFDSVHYKGSELNDLFVASENKNAAIQTKTNNSGGIQGGISNGMPIYFNVAFKPVATIMQKQASVNKQGEAVELEGKGRHDPCVLPRAVPIVESMAALVIADFLLLARCNRV
ncbi:chorismate synthase [Aurantibacillus circumpalustris]|uniref:chorismate synthase n=1 Tax=Aurantibacillus circumpalustris TaxID=3036359 RepID=UPI00295BC1E3|nr:chorismate synthase [Aurantibacillus circumpalustris]